MLHGAGFLTEALVTGRCAEHVRAGVAQIVPPGHGKAQMLLHGLAHDYALCVIEFKGVGVVAVRPFVLYLWYIPENLAQLWLPLLFLAFFSYFHYIFSVLPTQDKNKITLDKI
jgi:hypothetical protein